MVTLETGEPEPIKPRYLNQDLYTQEIESPVVKDNQTLEESLNLNPKATQGIPVYQAHKGQILYQASSDYDILKRPSTILEVSDAKME